MKFWSPLVVALLLAACADTERTPSVSTGGGSDAALCTDADGDGYGESCVKGGDCDDADPLIHQGCLRCERPSEGCACDSSKQPVSCYLKPSATEEGMIMCHEGTRYCRDGSWSGCESVFSYPKPETQQNTQAVVSIDAGVETCSDCRPNCFVIRDNLDPNDAGIDGSSTNTQVADGGGLTLSTYVVDAGKDASTYDPSMCMVGSAPDKDCDGVLDQYDPYPTKKPFSTTNPTIFLDLARGATGTGVVDLAFYLNSADVYFLIDQTGSMDGERARLATDLTSGDFIKNPAYHCSDYDHDKVPNDELKLKGIIGAIRCYIRDANFGAGFYREFPFDLPTRYDMGGAQLPDVYGNNDEIAYRNYQDITSDLAKITSGVSKLAVDGNIDWPEAAGPALYSTLTGSGMYFGTTKPAIPSRLNCPPETWGYPCFRDKAIPIIVLFTDAQLHNGPPTAAANYDYDNSLLSITQGTDSTISELKNNDNLLGTSGAADLGDLSNSVLTFYGDTTGMTGDLAPSTFTCATDQTVPDAFFKFSLSSTKTVTLTTEGSDFDTVLGIWRGVPSGVHALSAPADTNDNSGSAYGLGNAYNQYLRASGSSTSLASDYLAADLGCNAYAGSADAAFTFTLSQPTRVAFDTIGSSTANSVSVFSGSYNPPTYTNLSAPSGSADSNDNFSSVQSVGSLNGQIKAFMGKTSGLTADWAAAQTGCNTDVTADSSKDASYQFSLGSATRVRLSAEDSTIDTVLSLVDNNGNYLPFRTSPVSNDNQSNTYNMGVLDGRSFRMTGSTGGLTNDYNSLVGCTATTAKDAVFKFSLGSTRNVEIDTVGTSAFDSIVGLFKGSVVASDTSFPVAGAKWDNGLAPGVLGTVNNKRFVATGGTTAGLIADYNAAQMGGCGPASSNTTADAVYSFNLTSPTRVRIDTIGTPTMDTVVSLHDGPLPDLVTTSGVVGNEAVASAQAIGDATDHNVRFNGTTTGMTANVQVTDGTTGCTANDWGNDAVYTFDVTTTGTYQIDTIGSGVDTILGLFGTSVSSLPSATPITSPKGDDGSGSATTGAVDVGTIDTRWVSYTGSTSSLNDSNNFTNCTANTSSKDAYFKFTVGGVLSRSIRIDTLGSGFDTVIVILNSLQAATGQCDDDSGGSTTSSLNATLVPGTYYAVIKGGASTAEGNYRITFKDVTAGAIVNPILACDDNGGGGSVSSMTRTLTPGTYYAVVKGKTYGLGGAYRLNVKHIEYVGATHSIACNNDIDGTTTKSLIETDLGVGTYYVVVKGATTTGTYTLTVQDVSSPPDGFWACNDNPIPNPSLLKTSLLNQTLTAGDWYVVLKGKSTASGAYTMTVRDTSLSYANLLACDHQSGSGGTSAIETDLTPGTYRVIVKGKSASDSGAYKLVMRDVTANPLGFGRVACDYDTDGAGADTTYVETDLAAGTYTAFVKGSTASGLGNYKLAVRDATNISADATLYCDNDSGIGSTSKISKSFTAGTYWVGVKGRASGNAGRYQLNLGGGTTTTTTYTPPTWDQTLAKLVEKKARVIPIISCQDDPGHGDAQGDCNEVREQAISIASATDTVASNDKPLVFDIDGDGNGLSDNVVKGIAELAQYLEMNVSVQVVYEPDANPGFAVNVKAIDVPGDGCNGIIGIEHQKCAPGANPRFEVSFTNPWATPVPLNDKLKDPKGGYNFRIELIANNQFIVDSVPVYIIPEEVTDVPRVYPTGTYWQDLKASGCSGTSLPDWNELSWDAVIPDGTSVAFAACTSGGSGALSMCTPTAIAKITGGHDCTSNSECTDPGAYCSTNGNCQRITAGACTSRADCFGSAMCLSNTCVFEGQPLLIGDIIGSANLKPNLRMKIDLTGNTDTNTSPIVHDWSVNYLCKSSL